MRLVLTAPPGHLLSLAMIEALSRELTAAAEQPGVRWITFEGRGGEFSWGADLREHRAQPMRTVLPATHAFMRQVLAVPVPTAALVDGRCLGGGFELALCCDDILATSGAVFGCPEVKVAAFPPVAAVLLPLRAGAARASRAIVTGDQQSADYWHDAGLVSLVPPGGDLLVSAAEWFDSRLAGRSSVALAHASRAARAVIRRIADPLLEELERQYLDELLLTRDAAEGVEAFLEKRAPRWKDG